MSACEVLEAVLWMLNTAVQWPMLPQCYPDDNTVHRRVQHWCCSEVPRGILLELASTLRAEGVLDVMDCVIDTSFASAKGGGEQIGLTTRGKGVKTLTIVDRQGLPFSVSIHAANVLGFVQLASMLILPWQF